MSDRPIRVLALPKYGSEAASTRQRLLQYAPHLAAHGISIEAHSLLDNRYVAAIAAGRGVPRAMLASAYARRLGLLLTRRDFDLLWVHYELFPYLPGMFERFAALAGKPLVYDFDDAIFHMYDGFRNRALDWLLRDKLVPLLSRADAVVAGNAYLADYARRHCAATTVIPTVVDTDRYVPTARGDSAPVIGWIGSPSTWAGVAPMASMLTALAREHGGTVRVVGAGPGASGIDGLVAVPWQEATEIAEVQRIAIGIMPVPDAPFMRGKCGYKLIQYMACGLPVVCSPVGVNAQIVTHGVNGLHARTEREWHDAIELLLCDPALAARMGTEGRRRAVEHYSLSAQAPRLESVLKRAVAIHDKRGK